MQLVKYSPLRELQIMERDLEKKLWENDWGLLPPLAETSTIDVYEENGNLVAEASLPNFNKSEIKVNIDGRTLEISAEHQEKEGGKTQRRYYFRESSNRYFRRVTLPEGVKVEAADASFKNGTLLVVMPKVATKSIKTVEVK